MAIENRFATENLVQNSLDDLASCVAFIDTENNETATDVEISDGDITVDSTLSASSVNPVQNKVVTNAINQLSEQKADKSSLTLGVGADGYVYLFVNGSPQGNGLDIKADVVYGDVIGYVDSNNNIILTGALADGAYTLKYEDADGAIVDIGTLTVGDSGTYTNQISISTDTDGSIFNSTGYKVSSRLNSSGVPADLSNMSASNPAFVTGFIPCKKGDIIRLANCFIDTNGTGSDSNYYGQDIGGLRVAVYNASKTYVTASAWSEYASSGLLANYTVDSNGYITEFSITDSNCAFVRLCLGGNPETAIVTINEDITDGGMSDAGSIKLTWRDGVKLDKATGAEGSGTGYAASLHIELAEGYTYTFSQGEVYGGANICYYDANGTGLGYELLWDSMNGENSKVLTPIAGAKTFRVRLYYGENNNMDDIAQYYSVTYAKTV